MATNQLKTVNVKGGKYSMVFERINFFRGHENNGQVWEGGKGKDWGIETQILEADDKHCLIKAVITNQDGRIMATGHAWENRDDKNSMVNKQSWIENGETSAMGRALANLGIGAQGTFASQDEVNIAIAKEARDELAKAREEIELLKLTGSSSVIRPLIGEDWVQYFLKSFEIVETVDQAEQLMTQFMSFSTDEATLRSESPDLMMIIEELKGPVPLNLSLGAIATVQKAYTAKLQQIAGSTNYCNILYQLMQGSDHNIVMSMFSGKTGVFTNEHQNKIRDSLGLKKWLLGKGVSESDILSVFPFLSKETKEIA